MPGTTIMTHGDCDGICAGAVALARFPKSSVFFTKPTSFLDDFRQVSPGEGDKIIIADIALTKKDARQTVASFGASGAEIHYFDHHVIPSTVRKAEIKKACVSYTHSLHQSASELIYRKYKDDILPERIWIALYGAIGDYASDTPFVKQRLLNWDVRALYFEVSTIVLGTKNEEFSNYDAKREIVTTMAKGGNPSDVPGLVRSAKDAVTREFEMYDMIKNLAKVSGDIAFVMDKPSFGFRGPAALFSATAREKPVGMCVHTRDNYIDITIRARLKKYKLNELAEKCAEYVKGSGGGHEEAAGAKIPLGTFEKFVKKLNAEMKKS